MGRGRRSKKRKLPGVVYLPGGVVRIRPTTAAASNGTSHEQRTAVSPASPNAPQRTSQPAPSAERRPIAPERATTTELRDGVPHSERLLQSATDPRRLGVNVAPRTLDLVIGLDFGTAFTKCVVRAPTHPGEPTFAIPPGGNLQDDGLLSPSQVYRDRDGAYSLDPRPGTTRVENLKAPLIFRTERPPHWEDDVVAFLALILRQVRGWMLRREQAFIEGRNVRWSLNMGLPAASHDDGVLEETFLRLGRLAWSVSTESGPISGRSIQATRESGKTPDAAVEVIPEVAAAVTGYARSRQRRDGLHLLVDVGAGTFDACTFVLHDWDGDRISILQASVTPIGVLQHRRDPSYVRVQARYAVENLLATTRSRRDPNSRNWYGELRYFLAGGGRSIPEYRSSIPSGGPPFFREVGPIEARSLKPTVSDAIFRRLIVAWGLSYDSLNIGRIDKPHTIEDIERYVSMQHRVTLAPPAFRSGPRYDED